MLFLRRIQNSVQDGTFGVLYWEDEPPFAVTLENPWLSNKRNISCIPAGTYRCKPVISPRHGETFQVMDVPDRTHILFHKGNTDEDTQGCILIGESFTPFGRGHGIGHSGDGFNEFMNRVDPLGFALQIKWVD